MVLNCLLFGDDLSLEKNPEGPTKQTAVIENDPWGVSIGAADFFSLQLTIRSTRLERLDVYCIL